MRIEPQLESPCIKLHWPITKGMLAISKLVLHWVALIILFTLTNWNAIVLKRLDMNIWNKNYCLPTSTHILIWIFFSSGRFTHLWKEGATSFFLAFWALNYHHHHPSQIFWPFGSWVFLHLRRGPDQLPGSTTVVWPVTSRQSLIQLLAQVISFFKKSNT